jgi:hypothetical protein
MDGVDWIGCPGKRPAGVRNRWMDGWMDGLDWIGLDWIGCSGKRLAKEGRHKAGGRSREALRTFQRVRRGLFYWLQCA